MPVITIQITLPEGADIVVSSQADDSAAVQRSQPDPHEVERYFRIYLSDNGRLLYSTAALIEVEEQRGPGYTLSDIAAELGIDYASAQSYHRTTGRSARIWKQEMGTEAPIQLKRLAYEWVEGEQGMRSRYQLPRGVAEIVDDLVERLDPRADRILQTALRARQLRLAQRSPATRGTERSSGTDQ